MSFDKDGAGQCYRSGVFAAIAAGLVLLVGGCSDATVDPQPRDELALAQIVSEMGFDTSGMRIVTDGVVVEGDIRLSREAIAAARARLARRGARDPFGPQFQYTNDNGPVLHYTAADEVRVYLHFLESQQSSTWPTALQWAAATRSAMERWNAINGSGLRFVEGSEGSSAPGITVAMWIYDWCPDKAAEAEFPESMMEPGEDIRINPVECGGSYTHNQRTAVMMHELGHTVGFRHTDEDCFWCKVHVPGSPLADDFSIMNHIIGSLDFSSWDIFSIRQIYPATWWDSSTLSIVNNHPAVSWPAQPDVIGYNVYFAQPGGTPDDEPYYLWDLTLLGQTTGTSFVDTTRYTTQIVPCVPASQRSLVVRPVYAGGVEAARFLQGNCFNPPPPLSVNFTGPGSFTGTNTLTWTAQVSGGIGQYSYEWTYLPYGSENPISLGTGPTATRTVFNSTPDFSVYLMVTSPGVASSGAVRSINNTNWNPPPICNPFC